MTKQTVNPYHGILATKKIEQCIHVTWIDLNDIVLSEKDSVKRSHTMIFITILLI